MGSGGAGADELPGRSQDGIHDPGIGGQPGPPADGGDTMFVRMTTLTFRLERYDEGIRIFNESVIPAAKRQKGFRASMCWPTGRRPAVSP